MVCPREWIKPTVRRLLQNQTLHDVINPVPTPLETVERWRGHEFLARTRHEYKALGIAMLTVTAIAMIVRLLVGGAWFEHRPLSIVVAVGVAVVGIYGISRVVKALLVRTLDRRASHLDEQDALSIVMAELDSALTKNPVVPARAMALLRAGLVDALERKT